MSIDKHLIALNDNAQTDAPSNGQFVFGANFLIRPTN